MRLGKSFLEYSINDYNERKGNEFQKKLSKVQQIGLFEKIKLWIYESKLKCQKKIDVLGDKKKRLFQKYCQKQYGEYLDNYGENYLKRHGIADIILNKEDSTTIVYSAMNGPIVKTERHCDVDKNVAICSYLQMIAGCPDSDIAFQGYAGITDKNGVDKYFFANVRRKQYKGLQRVNDQFNDSKVAYQGFYRDEDGVFYEINECYDGNTNKSNDFFNSLQKDFELMASLLEHSEGLNL